KFYDSIGFTCLMQFGDGQGIDGVIGGNESRFINHSSQSNVGAVREGEWRIVFYSLDDIAQGEELTFNYGFDPDRISGECLDSGRATDCPGASKACPTPKPETTSGVANYDRGQYRLRRIDP